MVRGDPRAFFQSGSCAPATPFTHGRVEAAVPLPHLPGIKPCDIFQNVNFGGGIGPPRWECSKEIRSGSGRSGSGAESEQGFRTELAARARALLPPGRRETRSRRNSAGTQLTCTSEEGDGRDEVVAEEAMPAKHFMVQRRGGAWRWSCRVKWVRQRDAM